MTARLRDERGQASAELMGMLWWMFLVALVIWQLMLAAWAVDQAGNAARTASRVAGRGGDPQKAAKYALSNGLRRHMKAESVDNDPERWQVTVEVPILIPGLSRRDVTVHRDAKLPATDGVGI
jgi:hypothetical protein